MNATVWDHLLKTIFYLPSSVTLSYFMVRTLGIKHKKLYIAGLNGVQIIFYWLFAMVFIYFSWGRTLNSFIQLGIYVAAALLFSKETMPRRWLSFALTFLSMILSEICSMMFFSLAGGAIDINQIAYATQNVPLYICYQCMNWAITAFFVFLFILLWDRLVLKTQSQTLWYYALFPVSQSFLFAICMVYISATGLSAGKYSILALITLFCLGVDVLLFRSMNQLTQKALAEERAAWSESLLLQQEAHYAQILSDTEDAARIRHDIRNQLQTAYSLMAQGDTDAAKSQLDGIAARLDSAPTYCAHKVVNALLTVKAERFWDGHIPFDCHCSVPQTLPFQGAELCSLFSNVLDNAYQSALHCPGTVTLTASVQQGWFIVSCTNPAIPNAKPIRRQGHGLGLTILEELATKYDGQLDATQENDIFKTSVWLRI